MLLSCGSSSGWDGSSEGSGCSSGGWRHCRQRWRSDLCCCRVAAAAAGTAAVEAVAAAVAAGGTAGRWHSDGCCCHCGGRHCSGSCGHYHGPVVLAAHAAGHSSSSSSSSRQAAAAATVDGAVAAGVFQVPPCRAGATCCFATHSCRHDGRQHRHGSNGSSASSHQWQTWHMQQRQQWQQWQQWQSSSCSRGSRGSGASAGLQSSVLSLHQGLLCLQLHSRTAFAVTQRCRTGRCFGGGVG
jgi:hypothetical protein